MSTREHPLRTAAALALATLLAACASDTAPPTAESATVYRSADRKQCEEGGLSSSASATVLAGAGIRAARSGCGLLTEVVFPAVCGASTGDIVLHEIQAEDLTKAASAGYAATTSLGRADDERGYEWVDCETRTPLP